MTTTEPNNEEFRQLVADSLGPAALSDMSDAAVEQLLNDVTATPLSDETVARILHQTNPAHPSDRTVRLPRDYQPRGVQPGSSKEIVMRMSNPDKSSGLRGLNRGSAAALVVSAVCLLVVVIMTARPRVPKSAEPITVAETMKDIWTKNPVSQAAAPILAEAGQFVRAAVGDVIQTKSRERRRLSLPDGSVLFVNENTTARIESLRQLTIDTGEVFLEVKPQFDQHNQREFFYVKTPGRTVTAIGTKFAVNANETKTDVLVTQGRVKIDGVDDAVAAGKFVRFSEGDVELSMAPRASEALNWTEDLMVAAPIVPHSEYRGGALVSVDPNGQEMKLSMRKYHVDVHIEDGFARTTIDQTYFNHMQQRLEGTFKFPLPADASLSRLAMYVGPKLMEGGMAERQHARNTFEQIVHTKKDPALLEWVDGTTFQMRVFPLEPREEKRLIISYSQRLNTAYGKTHYRFPAGHNMDAVRDWSTEIRVKAGAKLSYRSSSHEFEVERDEGDLILAASEKNSLMDRDIVLQLEDSWKNQGGEEARTKLTSTEHEGQQYLMIRHCPELQDATEKRDREPRNWVVLFETSGDRNPVLARAQVEVVRTLLKNAEHEDTFNIVTAGTRPKLFREEGVACESENIDAAIEFLERSHLVGALDFEKGLKASIALLSSPNRPKGSSDSGVAQDDAIAGDESKQPGHVPGGREMLLVHVGSGLPILGQTSEKELVASIPQSVRYVGVGVGKKWSRQFMKSAASRTGGYFTQINPDEKVNWRAFELLSVLNAPRLLNVGVIDLDEKLSFLTYTESVADGEEICAIARMSKDAELPESLVVSGKLNGKTWNRTVQVTGVTRKANYLPRSWARLEIDRLIADGAAKHRNDIISLSKAMYVMSPFTSLLVLENEAMYTQFNIDRGRKDHWALYPAPDTIKVVREPLRRGRGMRRLAESENIWESVLTRANATVHSQSVVPPKDFTLGIAGNSPTEGVDLSWGQSWFDDFTRGLSADVPAKPEPLLRDMEIKNLARLSKGFLVSDSLGREVRPQFRMYGSDRLWEERAVGLSGSRELGGYREELQSEFKVPSRFRRGGQRADFGLRGTNGQAQRFEELLEAEFDWFGEGEEFSVAKGLDFERARVARRKQANVVRMLVLPESGVEEKLRELLDGESQRAQQSSDYFEARLADVESLGFVANTPSAAAANAVRLTLPDLQQQVQLQQLGQNKKYLFYRQPPVRFDVGGRGGSVGAVPDSNGIVNFESYGLVPGYPVDGFYSVTVPPTASVDFTGPGGWMYQPPGVNLARRTQGRGSRTGYKKSFSGSTGAFYITPFGDSSMDLTFGSTLSVAPQRDRVRGRFLSDLMAHAPGLNSTQADLLSVVAATTEQPKRGRIDDAARKLIEKARGLGWESVTLGADENAVSVYYNGRGEFAWSRNVSEGLEEQVLCDGDHLWHVYREIGLAAKRDYSRFHQNLITNLAPWLVASVDDLAIGADVVAVGDRTVAIVRQQGSEQRDENDDMRIELAFAKNGRLKERRIVRMSGEKNETLLRIAFSKKGKVTVFDSEGETALELDRRRVANAKAFGGLATMIAATTSRRAAPVYDIDSQLKDLVVLPLPFRSANSIFARLGKDQQNYQAKQGDYSDWSDEDALALLAADAISRNVPRLGHVAVSRFFKKGDTRPGLYVLIANGEPVRTGSDVAIVQHGTTKRISESEQALVRFVRHLSQGSLDAEFDVEMFKEGSFLHNIALARNTYYRWVDGRAIKNHKKAQVQAELDRALKVVGSIKSPGLGWTILRALQPHLAHSEFHARFADAAKKFENAPHLAWFVRHERARELFAAKKSDEAAELYGELLTSTLKAGFSPAIDKNMREQFINARGQRNWSEMCRQTAEKLIEDGLLRTTLVFSMQLRELGDVDVANSLFEKTVAKLEPKERPDVALLAIQRMRELDRPEEADKLLTSVLDNHWVATSAKLWRYGASLAEERGKKGEALRRLERAITIEYILRPDVINLKETRTKYTALLEKYEEIVDASSTLEQQPPADLAKRIIRAADQWRSMEDDETQVCQLTARLLTKLDDRDLAWDYVTTPLATQPGSASWRSLGKTLGQQGQLELADLAYERAFEFQQTDPNILWEHATLLRSNGKNEDATPLLKRIVDNNWQPRFNNVKRNAQKLLK